MNDNVKYKFYNWGPLVIKFKVDDSFCDELLNRDYYRGRFVSFSKVNKREIFNWDETSI